MKRLMACFGLLIAFLCFSADTRATRTVTTAFAAAGLCSPAHSPAIHIECAPGDSIEFGYTTSSPPGTSWCNRAAADIAAAGYTVTTTNQAQTGSPSWQWVQPGGFTPNGPTGGQQNLEVVAIGTNSLSIQNIYSSDWFNNVTYPLTGHVRGSMGGVSAVATGATTTITLSVSGVTANRSIGEYVLVAGTGIAGLDGTCYQITAVGGSTVTLNVNTTGATSTGSAYVCASSGATDVAIFKPTVAGTVGTVNPSFKLAGGTTDGAVTWGVPISLNQVLLDTEADILTIADAAVTAGYNAVALVQLLPRGAGMVLPQTQANQETQRLALNAWMNGVVGTHGIKVVVPFGTDPLMGLNVAQTANTTYYSDAVHPNDTGAAELATRFWPTVASALCR